MADTDVPPSQSHRARYRFLAVLRDTVISVITSPVLGSSTRTMFEVLSPFCETDTKSATRGADCDVPHDSSSLHIGGCHRLILLQVNHATHL